MNQESWRGIVGCLYSSFPESTIKVLPGAAVISGLNWKEIHFEVPPGAGSTGPGSGEVWKYQLLTTLTFSVGLHIMSASSPQSTDSERKIPQWVIIFLKTWSLNWHLITSAVFNSLEASNQTQPNLKQRITERCENEVSGTICPHRARFAASIYLWSSVRIHVFPFPSQHLKAVHCLLWCCHIMKKWKSVKLKGRGWVILIMR